MKYSILKEYMRLCKMYGWEPSWEGLKAYNAQRDIRKKWTVSDSVTVIFRR